MMLPRPAGVLVMHSRIYGKSFRYHYTPLLRMAGADFIPAAQRYCSQLQHRVLRFLGINDS
ncbi:hypothetical protein MQE22_06930 [Acidithiobacillus sp. YTS05]|nr:hypothetical protein MQE22_06930 [Acidithiobacillus sp. YTS05]